MLALLLTGRDAAKPNHPALRLITRALNPASRDRLLHSGVQPGPVDAALHLKVEL